MLDLGASELCLPCSVHCDQCTEGGSYFADNLQSLQPTCWSVPVTEFALTMTGPFKDFTEGRLTPGRAK